jgi:hypothetical protein
VSLDGARLDDQLLGDRCVGQPFRHELQHLAFAGAEPLHGVVDSLAGEKRRDFASWRAALPAAEKEVHEIQQYALVLADTRADLDSLVKSLERRYRAAERSAALAQLADRAREIDGMVRGQLADRVRGVEAEAETRLGQALGHDDMLVRQASTYSVSADVDELERLRGTDR